MENQFENHSQVTAKILEEFAWNQSKVTKAIVNILLLAYCLGIAWTVVSAIEASSVDPTMVIFLVVAGCMLLYLWYGPHRTAKRTVSAMRDRCGGEIPETVLYFGEEEITSDSPTGIATYDYEDILKIMSLKHSYILVMEGKKGLPVNRSGFTKGAFWEFKDFLRDKRPDLRIPD